MYRYKRKKKFNKYDNQYGGEDKKLMNIVIKSVDDNLPINSSIMKVTKIDRNLLRQINDLNLDEHFKREKDIYIGGIPYMAYEAPKHILGQLTELNPSTIYSRSIKNDDLIWEYEPTDSDEYHRSKSDIGIMDPLGVNPNPLTGLSYSSNYKKLAKDWKDFPYSNQCP